MNHGAYSQRWQWDTGKHWAFNECVDKHAFIVEP